MNTTRFYAACQRARQNQRHVTMLWNLADSTESPEPLWAILAATCPEAFDDPRDVNTIRFAY